jgi:hypothetical protein
VPTRASCLADAKLARFQNTNPRRPLSVSERRGLSAILAGGDHPTPSLAAGEDRRSPPALAGRTRASESRPAAPGTGGAGRAAPSTERQAAVALAGRPKKGRRSYRAFRLLDQARTGPGLTLATVVTANHLLQLPDDIAQIAVRLAKVSADRAL